MPVNTRRSPGLHEAAMTDIFPKPIRNLPEADIRLKNIWAYLSQSKNHQIILQSRVSRAELRALWFGFGERSNPCRGWLDLANTGTAAFGLVFLDSERNEYLGWWSDLKRLLRPGGLLVMDNAISHAEEMTPFVF